MALELRKKKKREGGCEDFDEGCDGTNIPDTRRRHERKKGRDRKIVNAIGGGSRVRNRERRDSAVNNIRSWRPKSEGHWLVDYCRNNVDWIQDRTH